MAKLMKKSEGRFNTVEAFKGCTCSCSCSCGKWYTKGTKKSSNKDIKSITNQTYNR